MVRPMGLPLSHLLEAVTKRPVSLECGLGVEQGVPNPAQTEGCLPLSLRGPYLGRA